MDESKVMRAVETLVDAIAELHQHTRLIRDARKWLAAPPGERGKFLMEMRHDLDDAMKQVRTLEAVGE